MATGIETQNDHLGTTTDAQASNSQSLDSGPSLENPTWDYLFNSFTKIELQKHCRSLGLSKIWTTKDKLVDMIMTAKPSSRGQADPNLDCNDEESSISLQNILSELREMRDKLAEKDSEIEELNTMIKAAHVTINRLSDKVTTLEEKVKESELNAAESIIYSQSSSAPEQTLLIGDSNLEEILSSDLNKNCSIRTLQGATIDFANCWIKEDLDWTPSNCIIYCGVHDLMDGIDTKDMLDNLGSMISDLRARNENMKTFICELVPNLKDENMDRKIIEYNNKLKVWAESNGISLIKTNLNFRLGTGEVNEMCFKEDGVFLNRLGVIRLLATISKQCERFNLPEHFYDFASNHNFSKNVSETPQYSNKDLFSKEQPLGMQKRQDQGQFIGNRSRAYRDAVTGNNPRIHVRPNIRNYQAKEHSRGFSYDRDEPNAGYRFRRHIGTGQGHNSHQYRQRGEGCFKCGEFNHRSDTCRYDHKVRCTICHQFGHKSKFCSLHSR